MTRNGALLLGAGLVLAALVVFTRRHEDAPVPPQGPRGARDDDINWDALEQAEREVRDLEHDGKGGPPDSQPGDDWGPGAGKTPLG